VDRLFLEARVLFSTEHELMTQRVMCWRLADFELVSSA